MTMSDQQGSSQSFGRALSAHLLTANRNNQPNGNQPPNTPNNHILLQPQQLQQLQPPFPIDFTVNDILPRMRAGFRAQRRYDGKGIYRYACIQQARLHSLNLESSQISLSSGYLWKNEPPNVRQVYENLAIDVNEAYRRQHAEFPPVA